MANSRGRKILSLLMSNNEISSKNKDLTANCIVGGENKHTGWDMDDSSLSSNEADDSDKDKDYVPRGNVSSSDSDILKPSTSKKVRKKFTTTKNNDSQNKETISVLANELYLTSDNELNELTPLNNDSCRKVKNKTSIVQKGRKRTRNPVAWLCNIRSCRRRVIYKKGKSVAGKVMKPPCSCRLKCYERLSNDERSQIFNAYWDKDTNFNLKRQFILSCLSSHPIERSKKRNYVPKKAKHNTLHYNFTINNNKIKVCKVMFLNTLVISNTVVVNILKNCKPGGMVKIDQREKKIPTNKTSIQSIDNVVQHISSIPCYESHYCREKTQYKYLGPELNKEIMHELYLQFCKDDNIHEEFIVKKWKYIDIFDTQFKLSFKPPEVDTCDICDSFQVKLKDSCLNQEDREKLTTEYDSHLTESKRKYNLKSEDCKMSKTNSAHNVLTGDLQKCLPTPLLTNGINFYKRKLWTLNYTLFDSSDKSVYCMMWDESKGGSGGYEISSAILKWAENVIPNSTDVNEITLWSDNCFGQNKNISIIMCFFWIMQTYPQIDRANMKYLLKGHTHMEADTVHALIERKRKKLKNMMILTPWDWQQMVRQCSSNYNVLNMEQEDFLQFNALLKGKNAPFIHRKQNVEKEKVLLSSTVHIQMRQENTGMIYLKSSFDNEFDAVDLNRNKKRSVRLEDSRYKFPTHLPVKSAAPISQQKFNDLMSLLPYVPSICHSFYMNLPKSSEENRDYPDSDDSDLL